MNIAQQMVEVLGGIEVSAQVPRAGERPVSVHLLAHRLEPGNPALVKLLQATVRGRHERMDRMAAMVADLVATRRDYPFDPVVAAIIFRSLVARIPQAAREQSPPLSEDETADLLIACIRRGFFSHLA